MRIARVVAFVCLALGACAGGAGRSSDRSAREQASRADDFFAKDDYLHAVALYQRTVRPDGRDARAMYRMGFCWERLGNSGRALFWYEKAASVAPESDEGRKAAQRSARLGDLLKWDPTKDPPDTEILD
ncbi:MAG: hypothetical protein HYY17_14505 [Planctomycetes bacterium]|nr:hypothetical protein [Planctomycetota bacterium]